MNASLLQRIADGRTDLVFEHVAMGHPPDATDDSGVPLIKWCAHYGDVSAIRFLVGQGEALSSLGENLGLNEAAFHGHWPLCQFLLERGADVNHALENTAETPLHLAITKANRPNRDLVVKVLLANGASPGCTTRPGAVTGSFMRDCRTKGETPLHRAAAFGTEATIQRLLDAGAVIDAMDVNGESPLAWASWHLRPDSVLRKLCYGEHRMHPQRQSTYDHGTGWEVMGVGTPHLTR